MIAPQNHSAEPVAEPSVGAAGATNRGRAHDESAAQQPVADLLQEMRAHAAHYLAAQGDLLRFKTRRLVIRIVLALGAGLITAVAMVAATVLFVNGLAGALAAGLNIPLWAGQIAVPMVLMILVVVTLAAAGAYQRRASFRKVVAKYEHLRKSESASAAPAVD